GPARAGADLSRAVLVRGGAGPGVAGGAAGHADGGGGGAGERLVLVRPGRLVLAPGGVLGGAAGGLRRRPRRLRALPRAGRHAARADFAACLARAVKRRGWAVDAAAAVRARVAACADAFPPAAGVAAPRRWLGTGTFTHARLGSLAELVPLVGRRDQTMTHFGFAREELMELAHVLAGRGVERMVPFGEAPSFHRVWDGRGVAAEFTRLVTVFA